MKVIVQGTPPARPWLGQRYVCEGCGSEVEFEADDDPAVLRQEARDSAIVALFVEDTCPVCEEWSGFHRIAPGASGRDVLRAREGGRG